MIIFLSILFEITVNLFYPFYFSYAKLQKQFIIKVLELINYVQF